MKSVFIGGCGRSGTTFLGALIGRHVNAIVPPESQFKFDLLNTPLRSGAVYFRELENNWRFKNWGLDHNSLERKLHEAENLSDFLMIIVKEYGLLIGRETSNIWVDHTPNNIDHIIPLIKLFPDAKFIHLIRDGRAVAASVIPLSWGPNNIIEATEWWIRRLAVGLAAETYLGPGRILRVKYEDLIINTNQVLDTIIDFIGAEKDIGVENTKRDMLLPEFTQNQHKLVNKPPDKNRINGWRDSLTHREIEIFELKAFSLMQYFGYKSYCQGNIKPINTYESLIMKANNLFRKYYKNKKEYFE